MSDYFNKKVLGDFVLTKSIWQSIPEGVKDSVKKVEDAVTKKSTEATLKPVIISFESTRKKKAKNTESINQEVSNKDIGNSSVAKGNPSSDVKISMPKRSTSRNTVTFMPEVSKDKELSYVELAKLSTSIVMIKVYNRKQEMICTGSGIMIGKDGFILTNCHVISGGYFFEVRIEDDETSYTTDEIIKYNQHLDLAIIRIRRVLNPLSLYSGNEALVRGQKVVAIGSPLGLFNSVSDGIISGFRNIENVDMIQFSAPTSPGSSGGAVLNMYGEVIGISTAGFSEGQNINLAVPYMAIKDFAKSFIR